MTFNIAEFQNLRLAASFKKLTLQEMSRLYSTPEGLRQELLREDRAVKRFMEEVLPISKLASYLEGWDSRVRVRHVDGSQNYDGVLFVDGSNDLKADQYGKYFIEVANVVPQYEHLEREQLAMKGACFTGGNIQSRAKKGDAERCIEDRPTVRSAGDLAGEFADLAVDLIEKKEDMNYPSRTILLLNVMNNGIALTGRDWGIIAQKVYFNCRSTRFCRRVCTESCSNTVMDLWGL